MATMNSKTATPIDQTSIDLIDAVKAESARAGVSGRQLASALGVNKMYVYKRFQYRAAFSVDDLAKIAQKLGIALPALLDSAEMGARFRTLRQEAGHAC